MSSIILERGTMVGIRPGSYHNRASKIYPDRGRKPILGQVVRVLAGEKLVEVEVYAVEPYFVYVKAEDLEVKNA